MSHRRRVSTVFSGPKTSWLLSPVSVIVIGVAAIPAAANGPVAYFPFNGSTQDASGNGNHAVAFGAVPTADRFGNPDSAYLVGEIGYLEAPDSPSLDIADAFTVATWFRMDDMISMFGMLASKGRNTAYSVSVYFADSYQCPDPLAERRIQVSVSGCAFGFSDGPYFDCGTGEWRHVAVTVGPLSGTRPVSLYVDGALADTTITGCSPENSAEPLGIGIDSPYSFAGAIDELRLYDRELTAGEIAEIYNSLLIDGFDSGSTSSWTSAMP